MASRWQALAEAMRAAEAEAPAKVQGEPAIDEWEPPPDGAPAEEKNEYLERVEKRLTYLAEKAEQLASSGERVGRAAGKKLGGKVRRAYGRLREVAKGVGRTIGAGVKNAMEHMDDSLRVIGTGFGLGLVALLVAGYLYVTKK